jgi:hypothetical protein
MSSISPGSSPPWGRTRNRPAGCACQIPVDQLLNGLPVEIFRALPEN